jgi:hypothetical protein
MNGKNTNHEIRREKQVPKDNVLQLDKEAGTISTVIWPPKIN